MQQRGYSYIIVSTGVTITLEWRMELDGFTPTSWNEGDISPEAFLRSAIGHIGSHRYFGFVNGSGREDATRHAGAAREKTS
jgi:hypothetical protein